MTKRERNLNILYLILAVVLFIELYIVYMMPDDRFLGFARTQTYMLFGLAGFAAGICLVKMVSGRTQNRDRPQNLNATQIVLLLLLIIVWLVLAIIFQLLIPPAGNPQDAALQILMHAALLFAVGVLLGIICLYPEKLCFRKKEKDEKL